MSLPFRWLSSRSRTQVFLCCGDQLCGTPVQCYGDSENQRQRGHVFSALYLAHMGALDCCQGCQFFLSHSLFHPSRANGLAKGQSRFGFIGCRSDRAASLDSTLLHWQKRRVPPYF